MNFSIPFYFSNEYVKSILEINNSNSENKIRRVYGSLYYDHPESSKFEFDRLISNKAESFEQIKFFNTVLKSQDIQFVYRMDSLAPISNGNFGNSIPLIDEFFKKLLSIDVNIVLVSNQLLADYIYHAFPSIKIILSSPMQIDSIKKAQYLSNEFTPISIIPSTDLNKNFQFIESFKKSISNIELELTANEGCIFSCPLKNLCYSLKGLEEDSNAFTKSLCNTLVTDETSNSISKSRIIFPWDIEAYQNAGVDFINIINPDGDMNSTLEMLKTYSLGSISSQSIMDKPLSSITGFFMNYNNFTLNDIKETIPPISFFKNNNLKCKSICGVDCTYCDDLSKNN